jgi:hypothetical protein
MGKKARCSWCMYWRMSNGTGYYMCHYALDTGHCRLMPAQGCRFFKYNGKKRRPAGQAGQGKREPDTNSIRHD